MVQVICKGKNLVICRSLLKEDWVVAFDAWSLFDVSCIVSWVGGS